MHIRVIRILEQNYPRGLRVTVALAFSA